MPDLREAILDLALRRSIKNVEWQLSIHPALAEHPLADLHRQSVKALKTEALAHCIEIDDVLEQRALRLLPPSPGPHRRSGMCRHVDPPLVNLQCAPTCAKFQSGWTKCRATGVQTPQNPLAAVHLSRRPKLHVRLTSPNRRRRAREGAHSKKHPRLHRHPLAFQTPFRQPSCHAIGQKKDVA